MRFGFPNLKGGMGIIIPAVFVFMIATNISRVPTPSLSPQTLASSVESTTPRIIDGDTIAFENVKVRIAGIDAPDNPLWMKELATARLEDLVHDFGGLRCTPTSSPPARSYDRIVMQCVFIANNADVAGSMVSQGFAVDWTSYSHGGYAKFMDDSIGARRGLWRAHGDLMSALADRRH